MNGIQAKRAKLNPANYDFFAFYYTGESTNVLDGYEFCPAFDEGMNWLHNHGLNTIGSNKCSHCGQQHLHGVIYRDENGDEFHVGQQCASEFFSYDDKFKYTQKELKRAIENAKIRKELQERKSAYIIGHLHIWSMLQEDHYILDDIKARFNSIGRISEAQEKLIEKIYWQLQERKEEESVAEDVPDVSGRIEVIAKILSLKWQDSDWGGSLKMLLKADEGYKLWGSVPSSLNPEVGDIIKIKCSVERSRDDSKFGFFKRPHVVEANVEV